MQESPPQKFKRCSQECAMVLVLVQWCNVHGYSGHWWIGAEVHHFPRTSWIIVLDGKFPQFWPESLWKNILEVYISNVARWIFQILKCVLWVSVLDGEFPQFGQQCSGSVFLRYCKLNISDFQIWLWNMFFSESQFCSVGNSTNFGSSGATLWVMDRRPVVAKALKKTESTHLNALLLIVQLHCPAFWRAAYFQPKAGYTKVREKKETLPRVSISQS